MSKKRPGSQAGMNLVALDDPQTWERVEGHCADIIESIPNLKKYEKSLEPLRTAKECFTKAELDTVVLWKHTVGKNRIYNVKYLNSNTDQSVQDNSRAAIALALSINADDCLEASDGSLSVAGRKAIQEAMGELGKLKGVGPATASAVLTLVRPDMFCYLYDEVIDCFEPQRDYKISNYLRVNSRCLQIAKTLGAGWTPSRVAKTIWTAARFLAANGEDLSAHQPKSKKRQSKKSKVAAAAAARNEEEEEDEEDEDGDEEYDEDDAENGEGDSEEEEEDAEEDEADSEAAAKLPKAKRPRK